MKRLGDPVFGVPVLCGLNIKHSAMGALLIFPRLKRYSKRSQERLNRKGVLLGQGDHPSVFDLLAFYVSK